MEGRDGCGVGWVLERKGRDLWVKGEEMGVIRGSSNSEGLESFGEGNEKVGWEWEGRVGKGEEGGGGVINCCVVF